ncbi:MAG TPA: hypothetical protein VHB21_15050, partial [Minicystis sp.]|nr:hypothetical protein [Minicystis sp.]
NLKAKLSARGIPYRYVDIDAARREDVPQEAWGRVPKTRVVGRTGASRWIEGDDPDGIERAYRS